MEQLEFEAILDRIEQAHKYSEVGEIINYIRNNQGAFTNEQLDELEGVLADFIKMFDPPDCNWVDKITIYYPQINYERNFYGEKAVSLCTAAKQMHMPLPDYLHQIYDARDFAIYLIHNERSMGTGFAGFSRKIYRAEQASKEAYKITNTVKDEINNLKEQINNLEAHLNNENNNENNYTEELLLNKHEFDILNEGNIIYLFLGKAGSLYRVRLSGNKDEIEKEIKYIKGM
ncbi:MAG: hypothetical protein OWT28_06460 [Firmicutes bacterium]|nr:hypothetical protein [Bacillota bacterium]